MKTKEDNTSIGVLVMRLQVPKLHEGHHFLISETLKHHKKVIVFLGVSPVKNTRNNPLNFASRKTMLAKDYPQVKILPLYDLGNNDKWSKALDERIIKEVGENNSVILYGSRNGFVPHYRGNFQTVELPSTKSISGSELRKLTAEKIENEESWRAGAVFGAYERYPTTYPTVDVAILKNWSEGSLIREDSLVLLGRKENDQEEKWRFIGGFADINLDNSFEESARREAMEETGLIGVGEPIYVKSVKVDDWRYRNEVDGIMTTFFILPNPIGDVKASDDIAEVKWFNLNDLLASEGQYLVKEHKVLLKLLKAYLNKTQKKGEQS